VTSFTRTGRIIASCSPRQYLWKVFPRIFSPRMTCFGRTSQSGLGGMLRPLIIAHKGASKRAPENTVEAFELARQMGADWVELDVRLTADGNCVVFHDEALGDRALSRLTLEEVSRWSLPGGGAIPSLVQALNACTGMGVNLEIKGPVEPRAVAAQVTQDLEGREGPFVVSSFWPPIVEAFARVAPELPRGFLSIARFDPDGSGTVREAVRLGSTWALPEDPAVSEETVALARAAGIGIVPWTVDDPSRMKELADFGVTGVITNEPDVAKSALAGLRFS